MLKSLKWLLAFALLLLACNSDSEYEVKEEEDEAPRHSQFRKSKNFITRGFNYDEANKTGLDDIERGPKELMIHKPVLTVSDAGKKITVSFPDHPHKVSHCLEWIELMDFTGEDIYSDIPKPVVDQDSYEITLSAEKPLRVRVRVRYYCHIHGEFIHYVNLAPPKKKKTVLDRQGPGDVIFDSSHLE